MQPFCTKNGVELQNVQKEKGKEKCGSPSPVKILYRLNPYENVSSKYHLTDVFPRLYIGTDTEPASLSNGFLHGGGRPQKTQTC